MTNYLAPLDQRWGSDQASLMQRVATLERQIANLAAPQLLSQVVLAAPAASVPLPAVGMIPQTFTNLSLVISARSSGSGASGYDAANLQFNGVSAADYNWSTIWVTQGAGAVSTTGSTGQTSMQCAEIWNSHFASAGRGIVTIEIPCYSDATCLKSFTSSSAASDGGAAGIQQMYSGTLGNARTAAITSLTVAMSTGNFLPGSAFRLYGS